MNRNIVGAIFLCTAGVVLTIGTVGAQVAYAVVQAGFFAGKMNGLVPPGPQAAYPHWLVIVTALVLGTLGIRFLRGQGKM
jgi:hypothetical protein